MGGIRTVFVDCQTEGRVSKVPSGEPVGIWLFEGSKKGQ